MNEKTRKLVEKVNDVNETLCNYCNFRVDIEEEIAGRKLYLFDGKIYKTKKMAEQAVASFEDDWHIESEDIDKGNKWICRDFRDQRNIHPDIPKYAFNYIIKKIKEVYHKVRNEEFALFVGAAINLYYISGLHICLDVFDISAVTDLVVEDSLCRYIKVLSECILERVTQQLIKN